MTAKARVLAIDDQEYFRSFLVGLLGEAGYEVSSTPTGPRALEVLERSEPFDLVIMDIAGPPTHSVAALRQRSPESAFIVISGVSEVRSFVAAMHQGAADYLQKPIERQGLLRAVERALEHRVHLNAAASATRDQAIAGENLELMGRISLLERVLPLVAELDVESACLGFLELLCIEACADSGSLWLQRRDAEPFECMAVWGEGEEHEWLEPGKELRARLLAGDPLVVRISRGGTTGRMLLVPFVGSGRLHAVACLSDRADGEFGESDVRACAELGRLGGSSIDRAKQLRTAAGESLRDPATRLPALGYFTEVLETELHKAHRFGRRLCCLCLEIDGLREGARKALDAIVQAIAGTLRTTDVLSSDGVERYWVLITDTDPLGGVVLKRRLAERLREAIAEVKLEAELALGVASYPLDGETREELFAKALDRVAAERDSVIHDLGFDANEPLFRIGERLLSEAHRLPSSTLGDVAEFLVGELTCRPHDSGLLFLAPGGDAAPIMGPLMAMGDAETATEVFLATDGDTVPACSALTAVALPPEFSLDTTWMVRFGEGPPYALLAGPPQPDGTRQIYHSTDPVLVEHMTFRLCAEVGVGVRS